MDNFKKEFLPENTRTVFEYLSNEPLLNGFTLIGGTALSLQIGHRVSEDLDFWTPSETLNKYDVSWIIRNAQNNNFHAELTTPSDKVIAAKINGIDALLYAQYFEINNVKVTFFARKDAPYQYFNGFDRLKYQNTISDLANLCDLKQLPDNAEKRDFAALCNNYWLETINLLDKANEMQENRGLDDIDDDLELE